MGENWRRRAACRDTPYDWWFPEHQTGPKAVSALKKVQGICLACPVFGECFVYVVYERPSHGIWAGMLPMHFEAAIEMVTDKGLL